MRHLEAKAATEDIIVAHDVLAAGRQLHRLSLNPHGSEAPPRHGAEALFNLGKARLRPDGTDDADHHVVWHIAGVIILAQLIAGHFLIERTMPDDWFTVRV